MHQNCIVSTTEICKMRTLSWNGDLPFFHRWWCPALFQLDTFVVARAPIIVGPLQLYCAANQGCGQQSVECSPQLQSHSWWVTPVQESPSTNPNQVWEGGQLQICEPALLEDKYWIPVSNRHLTGNEVTSKITLSSKHCKNWQVKKGIHPTEILKSTSNEVCTAK